MEIPGVKSEIHEIADNLSDTASYTDAMYEIYVRMKVASGRQAGDEDRVVSHEEVKRRFIR